MSVACPAIYECTICQTPRQYGNGKPETTHTAVLNCMNCKQPTLHYFKGIAPVYCGELTFIR